ncbi:polyisoprenoid-binding protein [Mycobacterium kiyosense]|uniref:Polyisoprenoid-binding protein n=1 Tax=Mycobacterium kiyosense TaxID=2871094 RepID=A0AA37UXH3_9MYCO|nr:polyisoprenoid-binding protein [Mycobacterium kiyosense]BDE14243.1 polyisoprenoid-binding protein [Mycobacterium sp. 20KCMC460]GLB81541.1 polyisoprenoid-binding protein [Mycobacterium kiyosense]GLB90138.1 polyisoprenoid-binding protein [Mycobacterium kiyosense]GLB93734.1 polyisoprenoid-binding protein [Mycobacterium kiyosense]
MLLHTGVAGRAARMGHRLTIAMTRWRAEVNWVGGEPDTAELVVEVDSFEVLRGEGGVKSLSGPEKTMVRANALKSLSASRFPEIRFAADSIESTDSGYRLSGTLHICGKSRAHQVELHTEDLGDSWRMSAESVVRQTDYGVKPYSMFMGSLQVTDEVTVSFTAVRHKDQ